MTRATLIIQSAPLVLHDSVLQSKLEKKQMLGQVFGETVR